MNLDFTKEILYICSNNKKDEILKFINKENKLINIKFMTISEFMSEFFFSYQVKVYPYLMDKYNITLENAKEYLNNLYPVDINKTYKSSKINYLKEVKIDLINNNYLEVNNLFKDYLKSKKIIIDNINIDPYIKEKLIDYDVEYINYEKKDKDLEVVEFNDIEEEVNTTILRIIDLVKSGISLNNIYLCNIDNSYNYLLKKLFNLYNIPLELDLKESLNSVLFINEYFITGKIPEVNEENKSIVKTFINLLNKYVSISDNKHYKEIIKSELNNTYIPITKYQESVKIVDFNNLEVSDDSYVFLLGFNEGVLPSLVKDEDYFSDLEKCELGLLSSLDKNSYNRTFIYNKLTNINNLYLSYKLHALTDSFYPSSIIEDNNIKVVKDKKVSLENSDKYNRRKLSILLDNYNKFNIKSDYLTKLASSYDNIYNTYNHKFTGINNNSYLEYINSPLKLSYTSVNSYNLCPFKYYVNYVLKVDPYEESFDAFIGNLYHALFSICFNDGFNFELEFQKYLDNRILSPKENFLINRLKKELKIIIDVLKEQLEYTDFKNSFYEKLVEINLDGFNHEVIFKGIIDRLMYYKNLNDTYYAIVDYKTGSYPSNLNNLKYGIEIQLATYIYLVEKSNLFENPIFTGCYFEHTFLGNIKTKSNKTIKEVILDKLKLEGYSTTDLGILSIFDHSYTNSNIIRSMKVDSNGFNRFSKVLDNIEVLNLVNYTDKVIRESTKNILDSKFDIRPKKIEGLDKSCLYCKYKDICFRDINDYINLEKSNDLSFLGGEEDGN